MNFGNNLKQALLVDAPTVNRLARAICDPASCVAKCPQWFLEGRKGLAHAAIEVFPRSLVVMDRLGILRQGHLSSPTFLQNALINVHALHRFGPRVSLGLRR